MKTKGKASEQRVHAAEEAYTQAKQLYDEITDDLYEELPAFYDRCVCERERERERECVCVCVCAPFPGPRVFHSS